MNSLHETRDQCQSVIAVTELILYSRPARLPLPVICLYLYFLAIGVYLVMNDMLIDRRNK